MQITNKLNLPSVLVNAVEYYVYSRGDADISVTELISPIQQTRLKKLHEDEIVEDIADSIWRIIGSSVHGLLEKAAEYDNALIEERLYCELAGIKISGCADWFDGTTIQDYKVTSVFSVKGDIKPDWEKQLNCYKYLYEENGFKPERLQIVALLRDWKTRMRYEEGLPNHPVVVLDVPVWDNAKAWIEARALEHKKTWDAPPPYPECTAEERWYRGEKFAVMKNSNKRADKLFDDEEGANKYISEKKKDLKKKDKYTIVKREGENMRCAEYCSASPFCAQWFNLKPKED